MTWCFDWGWVQVYGVFPPTITGRGGGYRWLFQVTCLAISWYNCAFGYESMRRLLMIFNLWACYTLPLYVALSGIPLIFFWVLLWVRILLLQFGELWLKRCFFFITLANAYKDMFSIAGWSFIPTIVATTGDCPKWSMDYLIYRLDLIRHTLHYLWTQRPSRLLRMP